MIYGHEEIAWKTWIDESISRESKIHIYNVEEEDKTLCGVTIPDDFSVEVGASCDYGHGHCKRCEKAHSKLED